MVCHTPVEVIIIPDMLNSEVVLKVTITYTHIWGTALL